MANVPTSQLQEHPDFAVLWTRDDCRKLEEAGFLDYHYELIAGVITKKMGQPIPHTMSVTYAFAWLIGNFEVGYVLSQSSIDVSPEDNPTNEPQTDVVLLHVPLASIPPATIQPRHIRLNIEVADTTLRNDLNIKASLYARAGIQEYWVISIIERRLYIHTEPENGVYRVRTVHEEAETVAPKSAPQVEVLVSSLLPPLYVFPTKPIDG